MINKLKSPSYETNNMQKWNSLLTKLNHENRWKKLFILDKLKINSVSKHLEIYLLWTHRRFFFLNQSCLAPVTIDIPAFSAFSAISANW